MDYLKLFSTESEYTAYRSGDNYIRPNVSLCDGNSKVFYNYSPPHTIYEYVDLGLPSGTKWATCNVGASKPSDAGLYFQWGDTIGYTKEQIGTGEGQKKFARDWSDYKWYLSGSTDENNLAFKKYTTLGETLSLEDDAAHVNMGGDWHMPSSEQIQELIDNTTETDTTQNDVKGFLFTSNKDSSKSIFFPIIYYAVDGLVQESNMGDVWSSTLGSDVAQFARELSLFPGFIDLSDTYRCDGFNVRGVIDKK